MAMSVSSEMTFFSMKLQSAICPQLRTGFSAEDRGRIDTRSNMFLSHFSCTYDIIKTQMTSSNVGATKYVLKMRKII